MSDAPYRGFKKVAEDDKIATMEHPNGHKIQILKDNLSPRHRTALSQLPLHQADPQQAVGDDDDQPPETPVEQVGEVVGHGLKRGAQAVGDVVGDAGHLLHAYHQGLMTLASGVAKGAGFGQETDAENPPPLAQPTSYTPPEQATQAPPGSPTSPNPPGASPTTGQPLMNLDLNQAYTQQLGALKGIGQAQQQQAAQNATLYGNAATAEQAHAAQLQSDLASKESEIKNAVDDVRNGHINPNHYLENMDAGKKITTAIGMLLGGISDASGRGNPAMNFLNQQIERDLEAQRTNLGQKNNLLSALNKQYDNKVVAENMFRGIRAGILGDQINQAAAQSSSKQAPLLAQQAGAQLMQQYYPLVQKAAFLSSLQNQKSQGQQPQNPQAISSNLLRMKAYDVIDDKQYEKANAELGNAQEVEKLRNDTEQAFNDLAGKSFGGALSPSDRTSAIDAFSGRLAKLAGMRSPEAAKKQVEAILPDRLESESTVNKRHMRLHQLFDSMNNTPTLDGLGMHVPRIQAIKTRPPNIHG